MGGDRRWSGIEPETEVSQHLAVFELIDDYVRV